MKALIPLYDQIHQVVSFLSKQLNLARFVNKIGRKLALKIEQIISLAVFKQKNGIESKRALYRTFEPNCSYTTLVVNLNRWAKLAALILLLLQKINCQNQHPIKHIDSTDIPVCLPKNARSHQTMKTSASWGHNGKGAFFGLKLHLIADLKKRILAIRFTSGNVDDREMVLPLSAEIWGILVGDAGYVSEKLQRQFYQEHQRILLVKPRTNMKKVMTEFQEKLYNTRMTIELNFRCLKMFYSLITSLPRSAGGYFANYIWSLLAYQII